MSRRVLLLTGLAAVALGGEAAEPWREALRDGRPPWYDPATDTWRRIEIREPERPQHDEGGAGGGLGVELIAVLLIAALLIAAVLVVRQLLLLAPRRAAPDEAAPAKPTPAAPDLSALPLPDAHLPPDEGLRRAMAAGDWRRAVVWAHARLLLRLDAAGALRLERGATERALLASARAWAARQPARAPALAALERTGAAFAAVYFGHADADRALVDRLLAADRAAERALGGGAS